MNRAKLKAEARKAIDGKVFTLFGIFLVAGIVVGGGFDGYYVWVGVDIAYWRGDVVDATAAIYLSVANKGRQPEIGDMMYGFKEKIS